MSLVTAQERSRLLYLKKKSHKFHRENEPHQDFYSTIILHKHDVTIANQAQKINNNNMTIIITSFMCLINNFLARPFYYYWILFIEWSVESNPIAIGMTLLCIYEPNIKILLNTIK